VRTPEIELRWWAGCPSTERALAELRAALVDLGLEDTEVRMREVRDEQQARETGFHGSPTILIDGVDFVRDVGPRAGGPEEPVGLVCRVFRRRDGRISPVPDPDDLREALRRAAQRAQRSQ